MRLESGRQPASARTTDPSPPVGHSLSRHGTWTSRIGEVHEIGGQWERRQANFGAAASQWGHEWPRSTAQVNRPGLHGQWVSFLQLLLTCLCFAAAEKSRSGKTSRGPCTDAANQRRPTWPASRSPHRAPHCRPVATPQGSQATGAAVLPQPKTQPPHSNSFPILRRQLIPSQPGSLEHLSAAPASIVSRSPFPPRFVGHCTRIGSPPLTRPSSFQDP
jgi:hypothetical protein